MGQPVTESSARTEAAGMGPAKDVVCGKTVNPQATPWSIRHNDTTYYFCSLSCALQFKSAPDAFGGRTGDTSNPGAK
jgi:YHS domain-containing protein